MQDITIGSLACRHDLLRPLRDVGGQDVTDGSPADRTELVDELLGTGLAARDVVAGLEDGVALRRQTHLTADVAGHGSILWLCCFIIVGYRQGCRHNQNRGFHITNSTQKDKELLTLISQCYT